MAALVLSLLVTAAYALRAYGAGPAAGAAMAVIETPEGRWIYPLTEDRQMVAAGPLGGDLIRIEHGKIYAVDCPCPNRICHLQGRISTPGQWIACLPNQVFIRIEGADTDNIDATAY